MGITVRKWHPIHFDLEKLRIVAQAYHEFFYIEEDRYEESYNVKTKEYRYFKNRDIITVDEYVKYSCAVKTVAKNKIAFLKDYIICVLEIYLMKDQKILPVISVYFDSEEEAKEFVPEQWFGQEVSLHFYEEKKLYHSLTG